jgi:galactokinase/mevalonate kinase-like predicted kinase
MIQSSAPGRCGLIGTPTDMYGGSLISCSTVERATCTIEEHKPEMSIEVSGQRQILTSPEELTLKGDRLDVARAVLSTLGIVPGVTPPFALVATTDIPMQAGLAGSTAIIASIVGAVTTMQRIALNRYQAAELVRKVEAEVMQIICGFQDAYMVVFGGVNYMDFRGKHSSVPSTDVTPFGTVEPLQPYVGKLPIVLAHTGLKHHSGTVHKSLRERWMEGDKDAIDGIDQIEQLGRRGKKALLHNDWTALAELINRNHEIVRDLGGSGEANEHLIKAAKMGGALAAKLAGAGGGGTVLAFTLQPEVTVKAMMDAGADSILYPAPSPGLLVHVTN